MELDSIIEREEIQRREKREERREKREERRESPEKLFIFIESCSWDFLFLF